MRITAKSKYNYKTIKNYVRAAIFRKTNPLKKMLIYCLVDVLLIAVLCLEMFLLGCDLIPFALLVASIGMLVLELYFYFVLPRIRYHQMGEQKGCHNEFTFTDDSMRISSYDNGYGGESRIDYKVLSRVIETSKYLYIYQTKAQAVIVDKATIEGGTAEELRQKLQTILGKKYVIYQY